MFPEFDIGGYQTAVEETDGKKKIDKIKNGLPFKSDRIHKLSLFFLCFFLGICNKFLQRYTQNLLTVHALPRAAITRSFPELAGALVILFDARADRMLNFCLAFVSLNFHQKKVSAEPVGGGLKYYWNATLELLVSEMFPQSVIWQTKTERAELTYSPFL